MDKGVIRGSCESYFVMLLLINENVIAGEGAQLLSLLKIFYSTRDPDKKDWRKP